MTTFIYLITGMILSACLYSPVSAIWEVDASTSGWIQHTERNFLENALENSIRSSHYNIRWRTRRVTNLRRVARPTIGKIVRICSKTSVNLMAFIEEMQNCTKVLY